MKYFTELLISIWSLLFFIPSALGLRRDNNDFINQWVICSVKSLVGKFWELQHWAMVLHCKQRTKKYIPESNLKTKMRGLISFELPAMTAQAIATKFIWLHAKISGIQSARLFRVFAQTPGSCLRMLTNLPSNWASRQCVCFVASRNFRCIPEFHLLVLLSEGILLNGEHAPVSSSELSGSVDPVLGDDTESLANLTISIAIYLFACIVFLPVSVTPGVVYDTFDAKWECVGFFASSFIPRKNQSILSICQLTLSP